MIQSTIHFIVNTTAKTGGSASVWEVLKPVLEEQHIPYELHVTRFEGAATKIARKLSKAGEERIYLVAVGGDGTMNETINGITDFEKVRFGVIPAGSGNDFARGLGLEKSVKGLENIIQSIEQEEAGKPVFRMDLGKVRWGMEIGEERLFGISSGIGLDAIVCKKALTSKLKKVLNRIRLGQLTYILLTVATLFSMETAEAEVSLLPEKKQMKVRKMIFAAAMNLPAEGGGVPMAPSAKAADGNLTLAAAHGIPKWLTFLLLPLLVIGKHEKLHGFTVKKAKEIRLHTDTPMVLHADGEYCGDVCDVTFTCLPKKLQLLGKV